MPFPHKLFFSKPKISSPKCQYIRHPNSLGPFISKGEGYFPKDHTRYTLPAFKLSYPIKK